MSAAWMDVSQVPFDALLLLERVQLAWLPGWNAPEPPLSIALAANPAVAWYAAHKCPEIAAWVEQEAAAGRQVIARGGLPPARVRDAERAVLATMVDLLVYALDPAAYDAQPFTRWDRRELTGLLDFAGKTVIDVGAGTGCLALAAAPYAAAVFAVEPVANLRDYIRRQAAAQGLANVYPVDGLITRIPFPSAFADVTMAGHVLGDEPPAECAEMERVTRPGGMVIFCPGCNTTDRALADFMTGRGYRSAQFEEPGEGWKTKFWKTLPPAEG